MEEVWKDIYFYDFRMDEWIDYRGYYQVSNLGRVKSLERYSVQKHLIKERFLKGRAEKGGYLQVDLYINGVCKRFKIHRLVAEMFIPNTENKLQIDHIDTNVKNNNVNNLRWVTNRENSLNELTVIHRKQSQKSKSCVAIKNDTILFFKAIRDADRLKFDHGAVMRCLTKKQKTHLGYEFYYSDEYIIKFKQIEIKGE